MDGTDKPDCPQNSKNEKTEAETPGVTNLANVLCDQPSGEEGVQPHNVGVIRGAKDEERHSGMSRKRNESFYSQQRGRYSEGSDRPSAQGNLRGGMYADYEHPRRRERWGYPNQGRFRRQRKTEFDRSHYHACHKQQLGGTVNDFTIDSSHSTDFLKKSDSQLVLQAGEQKRFSSMPLTSGSNYGRRSSLPFHSMQAMNSVNDESMVRKTRCSPLQSDSGRWSISASSGSKGLPQNVLGNSSGYNENPVTMRERSSMPAVVYDVTNVKSSPVYENYSHMTLVKNEKQEDEMSYGALSRNEVLSCLLEMRAYKSKPETCIRIAESFVWRQKDRHDIDLICNVLIECVSALLPKSAAYAALVYAWAFLTESNEVKPSTDTQQSNSQDLVYDEDKSKLNDSSPVNSLSGGKSLAYVAVETAVEALNRYLLVGKIMEARNVLCFLLDLCYFKVVSLDCVMGIILQIIQVVEELIISEDAQADADYILRVLLVGSFPWIQHNKDETLNDLCVQCFDRLFELVFRNNDSYNLRGFLLRDSQSFLSEMRQRFFNPYKIKTLPRVLAAAMLPAVKESQVPFVTSLNFLSLAPCDLRDSLSKCRINASLALEGGIRLKPELGTPSGSAYGACYEHLWSDAVLERHLNGVRPLEPLELWVLRQLFQSIIHAFSETHSMCAEALLRIPIVHDQFEIELVNFIFSEMLRKPGYYDSVLFYYRLLHSLSNYQASLNPLIHEAIHLVVLRQSFWDIQTLETFSQFVAMWLSGSSNFLNILEQLDINRWTPSGVQLRWMTHWAPANHVLVTYFSKDVSHDTILEEQLPQALCEFLTQMISQLSDLMDPNVLRMHLPRSLLHFLSTHVLEAKMVQDQCEEESYEAVFFKTVLVTKFDSEIRRQIHLQRLETFVHHYMLGKSSLAAPVDGKITDFIRGTPKITPHIKEGEAVESCVKGENLEDSFTVIGKVEASVEKDTEPIAQLNNELSVIVKKQGDEEDEDESMPLEHASDTFAEASLATLVEQAALVYNENESEMWSIATLTELFVRCLLVHGCKTLTHFYRAFNNYRNFLDFLRHHDEEKWQEHNEVESFQIPILKAIFSISFPHKKRQFIICKLFVRRNLLFPETVQDFFFKSSSADELVQPAVNELLVWLVQNNILKLLETCTNTSKGHILFTSNKELEGNTKSCYQRLYSLVLHHMISGLHYFSTQEVQHHNDTREEFDMALKNEWISCTSLFHDSYLRYLFYFGTRFLYLLDVDALEPTVESMGLTHRSLATRFVTFLSDIRLYFYKVRPYDALYEILEKVCNENKILANIKSASLDSDDDDNEPVND